MAKGRASRPKVLLNVLLSAALLSAALLAGGCAKVTPLTPLTDVAGLLGRELLYLGVSEGSHLLIDPAAPGKTYAVTGAQAALFAGMAEFTEVDLAAEPNGGPIYIATAVPAVFRNVPIVAAASDKEAARLYPPALMDHFLYTGYAEFAVQEYSIKSSKLAKVSGSAAGIEFEVDVKPISSEFAPVASRWGTPGADGWVRGKRVALNLYRIGGKYCAWRPQWQNVFTEGTPPVTQTPPETHYKPITYENMWEAMYEGNTVEQVVWEDETYSYVTATRLSDNGQHFAMGLMRVDRAAGKRTALGDEILDVAALIPLARNDTMLYAQLQMAIPYSETFSAGLVAIQLATGELEVLLDGQTGVIGTVSSVVYIAQMLAPDGPSPGGIFSLDATTGAVRRVSGLPAPAYSTAYDSSFLMRAVAGKLYVLWPDPSAGDVQYAVYAIDTATGSITKVS